MIVCLECPADVCFLHIILFQIELNHAALGLCSLFTFKQAFGYLQQIRKRDQCKNIFQLKN